MTQQNILLADDDGDDCMLFREAISDLQLNMRLETVGNGEELLTYLKKQQKLPDVVFLDLNMPRIGGFDCLREIKRDERLKTLPVVIISTSFDVATIHRLREHGAACYVRKPVKYGDLLELIDKSLKVALVSNFEQPSEQDFVISPLMA